MRAQTNLFRSFKPVRRIAQPQGNPTRERSTDACRTSDRVAVGLAVRSSHPGTGAWFARLTDFGIIEYCTRFARRVKFVVAGSRRPATKKLLCMGLFSIFRVREPRRPCGWPGGPELAVAPLGAALSVIVRESGRSSMPETSALEAMSRGVLDPRMRGACAGMTAVIGAGFLPVIARRVSSEAIQPSCCGATGLLRWRSQ